MHLKSKYHGDVNLHHNGDWSGEAIINYTDDRTNEPVEVVIPCKLLLALGKEAAMNNARSAFVSAFEDMYSDDYPNLEPTARAD